MEPAAPLIVVPLFAGLSVDDLNYIFRIAQRAEFAPGAVVVRQGQPADVALILEQGRAQVMTTLPGGGEAVVAELGPGSVIGEMALLDSGVRSATVVAREALRCCSIERESFRMLIAQRNAGALAVNHRIALALCARLRELNSRILASDLPRHLPLTQPGARDDMRVTCGFDWRTFLPVLPLFKPFHAEDLDELLACAQVFDLPRGAALFEAGAPATHGYIVLRGALEISRERDGEHHRIGILGPGRLCGILALIEDAAHSMSAAAREHATLMEIPRAAFMHFYNGEARASLKFQQAINQELLQALARTNNHLTRLISQARIRNYHANSAGVHDLHRALCEQDCRTA